MKKGKYLAIILLAMSFMIATSCQTSKKNVTSAPYFLKYNSIYQSYEGDTCSFNIIFVASDESEFVKDAMKQLASVELQGVRNIDVVSWKFGKYGEYKDMTFYNLVITTKNKEIGNGKFSKIKLLSTKKEFVFDIGNWYFNILDKRENHFNIKSNLGAAPEFRKYLFTAVNNSNKEILINRHELKNEKLIDDIRITIDDKLTSENAIKLKPKQKLDVVYNFKDKVKADLCYYSPILSYKIGNIKYSFIPGVAFYGVPLADTKVNEIYFKYKNLNEKE